MVVGEKAFHTMDSQIFVAINKEIPLEFRERLELLFNEEYSSPSQSVTFLQKLVQENDDETTETQLNYQ